MHHKQIIDRQVYDATKQGPTLTKQVKNQSSIPMARKVGHFIIAFLSLSFIISSCTSYQHPDLEIRQLGFQLTPQQDVYLDTANAFVVLKEIRGTKNKLDSLLTWTDMLKDHDEERALIFANEAYRLATENNYRLSRAIAMYYRALLKGRRAILGEGVDDALADAKIGESLLRPHDSDYWRGQVYGLLGSIYRKTDSQFNSAKEWGGRSLGLIQGADLTDQARHFFKGQILLDLANANVESGDSLQAIKYFGQSLKEAESSGNKVLTSRIWRGIGVFYSKRNDLSKTDSAYQIALENSIQANDPKGLIVIYQRLGDLKNTEYSIYEKDSLLLLSNILLDRSLQIQLDSNITATLYYTYLIKAYNYNVQFELAKENKNVMLEAADSALYFYRLAMKQAAEVGAIRIMPSTVKNISKLCSARKEFLGKDCEEMVVKGNGDYYFKFINDNYDALVRTVTDGLESSNKRIRESEIEQAEAANDYRVNKNWTISAVSLLISALVFLILIQIQQQKRLQARMDALRAQINPHFMSNSLNAIENLVNRQENDAAAKYLIHFSRLSRKILSSSRNALTTLSEELKTLEHFLALEQLRFRDKLRYEISISDDLDPKTVQIPALILQPYVENAIWHGIKPKKEPSLLQIKAEKDGKSLKCTIEDDGVGRKKAQELKEQSILVKHKSQGMKITEERLQKVGKVKGSKVEIIDLYDETGEASGTRVIIRMPLKEA